MIHKRLKKKRTNCTNRSFAKANIYVEASRRLRLQRFSNVFSLFSFPLVCGFFERRKSARFSTLITELFCKYVSLFLFGRTLTFSFLCLSTFSITRRRWKSPNLWFSLLCTCQLWLKNIWISLFLFWRTLRYFFAPSCVLELAFDLCFHLFFQKSLLLQSNYLLLYRHRMKIRWTK